jgi:hypothetical protein
MLSQAQNAQEFPMSNTPFGYVPHACFNPFVQVWAEPHKKPIKTHKPPKNHNPITLTKFQHIVVNLHAAVCTVSECDLIARLLQSVPSDYDPLVQAIRLCLNEVTLLRRMIGALRSEALRMESKTIKPKAEP